MEDGIIGSGYRSAKIDLLSIAGFSGCGEPPWLKKSSMRSIQLGVDLVV
jgi:hypothetical protein